MIGLQKGAVKYGHIQKQPLEIRTGSVQTNAAAQVAVTVLVLARGVRQSHQSFTGRNSPDLDVTVGDPKECRDDWTCTGGFLRRPRFLKETSLGGVGQSCKQGGRAEGLDEIAPSRSQVRGRGVTALPIVIDSPDRDQIISGGPTNLA